MAGRQALYWVSILTSLVLAGCASGGGSYPVRPGATAPVSATSFQPDPDLYVCRGTRVSNAPQTDSAGRIRTYRPMIQVHGGVWLAVNPVEGACLTSAFGNRGGRLHRGLDLQARPAGMVHAAGDGVVREVAYHRDYGNYVLIDHGEGVFTRYAHLAWIDTQRIREGRRIRFGTRLGPMGNSADYDLPVHLHYELLLGHYTEAERGFGLRAANILSLAIR